MLGLGTAAAGSSTIFSTGAFSSVSADRTVTVHTASDNDAVLSLEASEDYNGLSGNGDVIELNFSELNQNAVTTFANALEIGNNGSQTVEVTIDPNAPGVLEFSNVPATLDPGQSARVTIIVNLKDYNTGDEPEEITIRAET